MKLLIILSLLITSLNTAFASKARLLALGENANGSMFLSDLRSVFLNAAYINYNKDVVTLEWGDTASNVSDTGASQTGPRAEGGIFKSGEKFIYGLYLGEETDIANSYRAGVSAPEMNNTTFFIGGGSSTLWGASLTYGEQKDHQATNTIEAQQMRGRIGVIRGNLDVFGNLGLKSSVEKKTGASFKGKSAIDVGATYNKNTMSYMIRVATGEVEETNSEDTFKGQNTHLGIAKNYRINDRANIWVSGWYKMEKLDCDATFGQLCEGAASTAAEYTKTFMPISIAMEVAVKDWLTFRGSVGQNVFMNETDNGDDTRSMTNTTLVNAGASLVFGDFAIDGMIGNHTGTGNQTTDSTAAGKGTWRSDVLMSRVSMTYTF
jgi:hypothetical protein